MLTRKGLDFFGQRDAVSPASYVQSLAEITALILKHLSHIGNWNTAQIFNIIIQKKKR